MRTLGLNPVEVAHHLTFTEIRHADLTVDEYGVTWCEVSPGVGFRRLGGHWHFGTIGNPASLTAVTVPATLMVLDRWAARHLDPTPPHGIVRPLRLVR